MRKKFTYKKFLWLTLSGIAPLIALAFLIPQIKSVILWAALITFLFANFIFMLVGRTRNDQPTAEVTADVQEYLWFQQFVALVVFCATYKLTRNVLALLFKQFENSIPIFLVCLLYGITITAGLALRGHKKVSLKILYWLSILFFIGIAYGSTYYYFTENLKTATKFFIGSIFSFTGLWYWIYIVINVRSERMKNIFKLRENVDAFGKVFQHPTVQSSEKLMIVLLFGAISMGVSKQAPYLKHKLNSNHEKPIDIPTGSREQVDFGSDSNKNMKRENRREVESHELERRIHSGSRRI